MRKLLFIAAMASSAGAFAYMPIYSVNIDSMALGDVASQGVTSLTAAGGSNAAVIADPTGASRGQVIKLFDTKPTQAGNERRLSGALFTWDVANGTKDLVNSLYTGVRITFDIYVDSSSFQNLYFTNSNRDTNFSQTINDGKTFQFGGTKTAGGTIVGNTWWSVTLDWDKVAGTRAATITNGTNTYNVTSAGLGLLADPSAGSAQFYRFNIRTITDNRPNGPQSLWYIDNFKVQAQSVPEPATLAVLGIGALALIRRRRSR